MASNDPHECKEKPPMGRHDLAVQLTPDEVSVVRMALESHADHMLAVTQLNPDWDPGKFMRRRTELLAIAGKLARPQCPVLLDVLEAATAHESVVADLERRQWVMDPARGYSAADRNDAKSGMPDLTSAASKLFGAQRSAFVGSWAWS
jgi:hypothetical protein